MMFERAVKGDAAAIVSIFRATMEPDLLQCVPLGTDNAAVFIEDAIATRFQPTDNSWWVARDGEVAGFCEVRNLSQIIFTNYLHIAPAAQSRRIGAKLFASALAGSRRNDSVRVALDVSEENKRARSWYERLTFRSAHITSWQLVELKGSERAGDAHFSGLPQADIVQARYGFSALAVTTQKARYDIGRLGATLYRATAPGILSDPDALLALHQCDPARQLLIIAEDGAWTREAGRNISRRIRMEAKLSDVLGSLHS